MAWTKTIRVLGLFAQHDLELRPHVDCPGVANLWVVLEIYHSYPNPNAWDYTMYMAVRPQDPGNPWSGGIGVYVRKGLNGHWMLPSQLDTEFPYLEATDEMKAIEEWSKQFG